MTSPLSEKEVKISKFIGFLMSLEIDVRNKVQKISLISKFNSRKNLFFLYSKHKLFSHDFSDNYKGIRIIIFL
jgi:hypothetical protein